MPDLTPLDEHDDHADIWAVGKLEKAMLDGYLHELKLRLKDPPRLEELYGSHFFDQEVRTKLDGICRTVTQLLDTPASSVHLVSDSEQMTVATYGGPDVYVGLDRSFCQHVVGTERDLTIEDALRHALVCDSTRVLDDGVRSYLGVPLMTRNGHILGALCTWDYVERTWRPADVAVLTQLAVVVMRFHEAGV